MKRRDHIAEAAAFGMRIFVVDSPAQVHKVAEAAPGTAVLCRLVTSGDGSDWPLSRKNGCSVGQAVAPVELPLDLSEGDIVRVESAGAYRPPQLRGRRRTACYSRSGFNGFEPLPVVVG